MLRAVRLPGRTSRPSGLLLAAGLGLFLGCGDIGAIEMDLVFPDPDSLEPPEDLERRTRALRIVVRQVPPDGASGCDALWGEGRVSGLREESVMVSYPNRNDILAANVDLDLEERAVTLLVWAHAGLRPVTVTDQGTGETELDFEPEGDALLGGCAEVSIPDPNVTQRVQILLEPPP